jgi:hypothetical protein
MSLPYTYLIGWSNHNIWYYGARYAKNCHPKDLWKTYFTSSKYVAETIKTYGNPDVIQIRKTFLNANEARNWEHKVLKRIDVLHKPNWLNKTNNKAILLDENMKEKRRNSLKGKQRKPHSEQTKQKISKARLGTEPWNKGKQMPEDYVHGMKGKKHSEESNEKNRKAHLGKTNSAESNLKRSLKLKNRVFSEETKEKLKQAALLREAKKREEKRRLF